MINLSAVSRVVCSQFAASASKLLTPKNLSQHIHVPHRTGYSMTQLREKVSPEAVLSVTTYVAINVAWVLGCAKAREGFLAKTGMQSNLTAEIPVRSQ